MSYNLYFKNKNQEHSIAIIRKTNPDILFVQELTPNWASKIERNLSELYKYKLVKPLNGTHGIGIYSKFKISNQKFLLNTSRKPYAQSVNLYVEDKSIQLINVHLASPAMAVENKDKFFSLFKSNYKTRKHQIIKLNEFENRKFDCQLLVGDLNTLQSEPIFKRLKLNWVNSNNGLLRWIYFNFPHSSKIIPIVTLDYILGRGNLKFIESKVIEGGSSDHLAIMTKLKI